MHHHHHHDQPLCTLRVADSTFLGYASSVPSSHEDVLAFRRDIVSRNHHPDAPSHVSYAFAPAIAGGTSSRIGDDGGEDGGGGARYDDDGEPTAANVGEILLGELGSYRRRLRRQSTMKIRGGGGSRSAAKNNNAFDEFIDDDDDDDASPAAVATTIVVVRYFGKRLLGVTCGRLSALYARTARLALHRHLHGRGKPFVERYSFGTGTGGRERERGANDNDDGRNNNNLYGLGAGDTELILDVVASSTDGDDGDEMNDPAGGRGGGGEGTSGSRSSIVDDLLSELKFEGMVGSKGEPLPRLQNLQADLPNVGCDVGVGGVVVPVYRYPGNYSGTEWPTHPWSPSSLSVRRSVEDALRPLYSQRMNHCVTNLYRDGSDRIDRHSDKDLDLNRDGVIVSVSMGSTRVMEVRDRQFPHDAAFVELPYGSVFVLGPCTNARFTHAILPATTGERDDDGDGDGRGNRRVGLVGGPKHARGGGVGGGKEQQQQQRSLGKGGRISLTFRDVRTFLDLKSGRLFGQGVSKASSSSSPTIFEEDKRGGIAKRSLAEAARIVGVEDERERNGLLAIALGIGGAASYVVSSKFAPSSSGRSGRDVRGGGGTGNGGSPTSSMAPLLRYLSASLISASASYWCLRRQKACVRRRREEEEARAFFSKKSASGNRY